MKLFTIAFLCLMWGYTRAQDSAIIGLFNDDYIIWDTTNLIFAKKLSDGIKGDSCLIFGFLKSSTGSIWYRVGTVDTIGYVMADFINYDKFKYKVYPLKNFSTVNYALQLFTTTKSEWLSKKEKSQQEAHLKMEKNKDDFKKFISKNDLFIVSHSFPESEYLKYPGFKTTIVNSNQNKVIKYLWFTITAYNPVDDIVGTKTVQAIGPVYPLKTADYNFEMVFKSNIIDYCKISSIKIQYMDGSVILFNKEKVESILLKSKVFLNYVKEPGF